MYLSNFHIPDSILFCSSNLKSKILLDFLNTLSYETKPKMILVVDDKVEHLNDIDYYYQLLLAFITIG